MQAIEVGPSRLCYTRVVPIISAVTNWCNHS
jgi:hypothetical protein